MTKTKGMFKVNDPVRHGFTGGIGIVTFADPENDTYSIKWGTDPRAWGYCRAELEENRVRVPQCVKCLRPLALETDPDLKKEYLFVCHYCDENFYGFEAV